MGDAGGPHLGLHAKTCRIQFAFQPQVAWPTVLCGGGGVKATLAISAAFAQKFVRGFNVESRDNRRALTLDHESPYSRELPGELHA